MLLHNLLLLPEGNLCLSNSRRLLPSRTLYVSTLSPRTSVDADFVAASFIRSAANVRSVIAYLERCCDEQAETGKRCDTRLPSLSNLPNLRTRCHTAST